MRGAGLRLVTQRDELDDSAIDDIHCPLCLFREFNEIPCYHKPLPPLPTTDKNWTITSTASSPKSSKRRFSWSSATSSQRRFSPSGYSKYFLNNAEVPPSPTDSDGSFNTRLLRRKPSPTTVTLRELRARHSQESVREEECVGEERAVLRSMQSDEQLQLVYESQIMAYLMSPLSELDGLGK